MGHFETSEMSDCRIILKGQLYREIDVVALEDLARRVREAALGEQLRPLHEQEDGAVVDQALDALPRGRGEALPFGVGHHAEGRDDARLRGGRAGRRPSNGAGGEGAGARRDARQSCEEKDGSVHGREARSEEEGNDRLVYVRGERASFLKTHLLRPEIRSNYWYVRTYAVVRHILTNIVNII